MKLKRMMTLLMCLAIVMAMIGLRSETACAASAPKLAKKSVKLYLGASYKVKVKNAKKAKITYSSLNKKVATVNKNGKVKAKKAGKAKIKVVVKKGSKKTKLYCQVTAKRAKIAVLDTGASKSVKVAKAYTVTDAPARGAKGGHADRQIAKIKKEAPKASIISIRISDSDGINYSYAAAEGFNLAVKLKADIIYIGSYFPSSTEDMEDAVYKAIAAKIKIAAPAGNENGADARKRNWMTNVKGATVVGAWGDKGILKTSNKHANLYIKAGSTSAAAARYAGMLAAGHVYDVHYK